jgi:D-sedoheptulose 7-phosphate isomerase
MNSAHISEFLAETKAIADSVDREAIRRIIELLAELRERQGRLFVLGVGGSAANASHAVNDFRKIVGIEAYAPTDNVAELTARVNDDGWETSLVNWLRCSRLRRGDGVLVFSVGGGSLERNVSANIVYALRYAKQVGAVVMGLVSRDGGYTAEVADACVVIPSVNAERITPHAEAWQAVLWHMIVSHPAMKRADSDGGGPS